MEQGLFLWLPTLLCHLASTKLCPVSMAVAPSTSLSLLFPGAVAKG